MDLWLCVWAQVREAAAAGVRKLAMDPKMFFNAANPARLWAIGPTEVARQLESLSRMEVCGAL